MLKLLFYNDLDFTEDKLSIQELIIPSYLYSYDPKLTKTSHNIVMVNDSIHDSESTFIVWPDTVPESNPIKIQLLSGDKVLTEINQSLQYSNKSTEQTFSATGLSITFKYLSLPRYNRAPEEMFYSEKIEIKTNELPEVQLYIQAAVATTMNHLIQNCSDMLTAATSFTEHIKSQTQSLLEFSRVSDIHLSDNNNNDSNTNNNNNNNKRKREDEASINIAVQFELLKQDAEYYRQSDSYETIWRVIGHFESDESNESIYCMDAMKLVASKPISLGLGSYALVHNSIGNLNKYKYTNAQLDGNFALLKFEINNAQDQQQGFSFHYDTTNPNNNNNNNPRVDYVTIDLTKISCANRLRALIPFVKFSRTVTPIEQSLENSFRTIKSKYEYITLEVNKIRSALHSSTL